jgi:hypothetical protein
MSMLVFLGACGSGETPEPNPSAGTGGAPISDGSADALDFDAPSDGPERCMGVMPPPMMDAATCNSLAQQAPTVDVADVASDPPASKGGTIVDVLYFKTASVFYTGPGGHAGPTGTQERTTLLLNCGVFHIVVGTMTESRISGSFTSSPDGHCELAPTCGNAAASPISGYDATPTSITFYAYQAPAFGVTYTRQNPMP